MCNFVLCYYSTLYISFLKRKYHANLFAKKIVDCSYFTSYIIERNSCHVI